MRRIGTLRLLLAGTIVLFLQSAPGYAQATRTWVSGVGDDANPCSRTAPCKTFAGSISKTAAGGEINVLDPGGFGGVTITKGITIDGGGFNGSILVSGTAGVTINAAASDRIVLRNLSITGVSGSPSPPGTTGVNILAGLIVTLENVTIANFSQSCVKAQVAGSVAVNVIQSHLDACAGGGILSSGGTGNNRINVVRSTLSRTFMGLQAGANSTVTIWQSSLLNSGAVGVQSTAATAQVMIDQSTIAGGGIGVQASNNSIVRIAQTSVTNNVGTGLLADTGGQILTWSNNFVGGNNPDGTRTGTIVPQ